MAMHRRDFLRSAVGAPVGSISLRHCRFNGVTVPSVVANTQSVLHDDVRINDEKVGQLQTTAPAKRSQ